MKAEQKSSSAVADRGAGRAAAAAAGKRKIRCNRGGDATDGSVIEQREKMALANEHLLEHWQHLRRRGEQRRLQDELGTIISESMSSASLLPDDQQQQTTTALASSPSITSAQLMDTWLEATNMDEKQLADLEREFSQH